MLCRMDGEAEVSGITALLRESTTEDPRWVRIDLSWEHIGTSQQLGAHFACLKAALRPGFPPYDGLE